MKLTILLFGTSITAIISLSSPDKDIKDRWVMQDASVCSTAVLQIKMHEGIWVGK